VLFIVNLHVTPNDWTCATSYPVVSHLSTS